jgi:hypothetical protein
MADVCSRPAIPLSVFSHVSRLRGSLSSADSSAAARIGGDSGMIRLDVAIA